MRQAPQGLVSIGPHRVTMRTEGEGGRHTSVIGGEVGDHAPPDGTVHKDTVDKNNRGPRPAGVLVLNGSRRQLY
jgi:hypothetical protein